MTAHDQSTTDGQSIDLYSLARSLDRYAKWWWTASLCLKLLGFVVGVLVVTPVPAAPLPFVVAALTLLAEGCGWRSDAAKSVAQGLRRKLDWQDALDWKISGPEYSDLLARSPGIVQGLAKREQGAEAYFASAEKPGPMRTLQNVSESAWWSKHLSESMAHTCLAVVVIAVIAALAMLITTMQTVTDADDRTSVAKVVTAVLILVLSIGLVKLMLGYYGFAKNAARSEEASSRVLQGSSVQLVDAIKIMNEYHLARAVAPIIPTWVWKLRRRALNETWRKYRQKG